MEASKSKKPRTALVFGASGQIGAALLHRLLREGWRVHAVSRQPRHHSAGVQWLQGDLAQTPQLPAAVDVVFSCGPLDAFARWYTGASLHCPRVITFGSTSVMVKHGSQDPDERDLAARLALGERQVLEQAARQKAMVTILRPTLVWGAGLDRSLSRIASLAHRYGLFVLPRSAVGGRHPVHVDDLADAAMAVIHCPASAGQAYALGGGEVLTYEQMVRRVLAVLPCASRLWLLPEGVFSLLATAAQVSGRLQGFGPAVRARMAQDLVFDIAPAQRDFGYAPRGFLPSAAELGLDQ